MFRQSVSSWSYWNDPEASQVEHAAQTVKTLSFFFPFFFSFFLGLQLYNHCTFGSLRLLSLSQNEIWVEELLF